MNLQSYNEFWQRIHRAAKNKFFPLRVMFELTYRCNFKCRHCYVPFSYRKKGELKTKEVFSILDQLAEAGCFYLGFTGGEPFMRRDIFDILWYAKKKGFQVIIYTNGSLINDKEADELAKLRPNKVDITIPAMSEVAFEQVTSVTGYRDKVFKAIKLLHKRKVNLGFKTCVLKENESEIKEIQDFAASLGALHRLDDMLSRRLDGSGEPYEYRAQGSGFRAQRGNKCDFAKNDEHVENRVSSIEYRILRSRELFSCGVGISQAAITPLGELKMCLMIDYPKYKILNRCLAENRTPMVRLRPFDSLRSLRAVLSKVEGRSPSALSGPSTRFARSGSSRAKSRDEVEVPITDNRKLKIDLKSAWDRLRDLVNSIKPDGNYRCNRCELEIYCKWCPARGWLANRSFTSCEAESRRWAKNRKARENV